jgi:hypothetical protein
MHHKCLLPGRDFPVSWEISPREKALGAAIKQNDKLEFAGWVQVRVYTSKYKIP